MAKSDCQNDESIVLWSSVVWVINMSNQNHEYEDFVFKNMNIVFARWKETFEMHNRAPQLQITFHGSGDGRKASQN